MSLEVREVWKMWHLFKEHPSIENLEMNAKEFIMNDLYYKKNEGKEGLQIVFFKGYYDGEKVKKDLRECLVMEEEIFRVFWEGLKYFSEKPYIRDEVPHFHQAQLEYLQCSECHELPRW